MSLGAINPVLWLEQAMAEDPGEPCPPLTALEAREIGRAHV